MQLLFKFINILNIYFYYNILKQKILAIIFLNLIIEILKFKENIVKKADTKKYQLSYYI